MMYSCLLLGSLWLLLVLGSYYVLILVAMVIARVQDSYIIRMKPSTDYQNVCIPLATPTLVAHLNSTPTRTLDQ